MSSTFKILFYLRKNHLNKDGKSGIMVRVTVNGERVQFSTKLDAVVDEWDTKAGKLKGKTSKANELNTLLDEMRGALQRIYHDIERTESFVSAEKVRNSFLGYNVKQQSVLDLFEEHNKEAEEKVGTSIAKATMEKYDRTYRRLKSYIKEKYKLSDVPLKEINHKFITGFETYLRVTCKCNENTTAKFIQFFKRIIIIAKNNGWIFTDPFANYKIKVKSVDRGYLMEEELTTIMNKKFSTQRLEQVRDVFIFSCFTGLAYIDVKNLRKTNIRTSFDGNLWIMTRRQKTDIASNIPLLDIPKQILDKYNDKLPNDAVLPVLSNQKTNAYLKEIGDICQIIKPLTFHLARHTFATTTTLAKGVPLETVSKMLGHTNLKTTQIYARITDSKISSDMEVLAQKLQKFPKLKINQSSDVVIKQMSDIDKDFEGLHLDEKLDLLSIPYELRSLRGDTSALKSEASEIWYNLSDRKKESLWSGVFAETQPTYKNLKLVVNH